MNKSNNIPKKIAVALIIIIVAIACYVFFNQISSIAIVTLESASDNSIIVLRPDRGYLTIKAPEIINTLLESGREYVITYDTYPLLGSYLKSIELSP